MVRTTKEMEGLFRNLLHSRTNISGLKKLLKDFFENYPSITEMTNKENKSLDYQYKISVKNGESDFVVVIELFYLLMRDKRLYITEIIARMKKIH